MQLATVYKLKNPRKQLDSVAFSKPFSVQRINRKLLNYIGEKQIEERSY